MKRSGADVIVAILRACNDWNVYSHIIGTCNLNFKHGQKYLSAFHQHGYVERQEVGAIAVEYRATAEGRRLAKSLEATLAEANAVLEAVR